MTPEEKQEIIGWVYDCTDGKGQVLFGIQSFESFLSAMPEESKKQIAKQKLEEFIKEHDEAGTIFEQEAIAMLWLVNNWLDQRGEG